ncbi:MAG: ribulose-phosphate 3-epimerase [Clostridia bacterium]|nr:ribulose-phosphate 3-epimerase [Clostridia bacterium]
MKTIAPSILASDFLKLGDEIKKIENSGAKYVHIDVMDGCFVPNISFGMPIIKAIRGCTNLVLDVHAMIINPDNYIDDFISSGADIVTFHFEALSIPKIHSAIWKIHSQGKKVGISIKPNTSVEALVPFLNDIDMVLIMTVEPGFGGQSFMDDMTKKVEFLDQYKKEHSLNFDIEVDGGINDSTIKIVEKAGANIFVLGTAFFKSPVQIKVGDLIDEN